MVVTTGSGGIGRQWLCCHDQRGPSMTVITGTAATAYRRRPRISGAITAMERTRLPHPPLAVMTNTFFKIGAVFWAGNRSSDGA